MFYTLLFINNDCNQFNYPSHLLTSLIILFDFQKVLRYLRVAQQYIAIQELGEAERYLLLYLQTKPESHEAHKVLGDLYLKQNKYYNAYEEHKTLVFHNELIEDIFVSLWGVLSIITDNSTEV